jgi:hypothetical protein
MNKYKEWELLGNLPDGWKIDKSAGSPLCGYSFCNNGKSILNGGKRALVFVGSIRIKKESQLENDVNLQKEQNSEPKEQVIDINYVRTVNELARKKFEQKLLNDIMVDLMVCEIEGWCKMEYIRELRKLLSGIASRKIISISRLTEDEGDIQTCLHLF